MRTFDVLSIHCVVLLFGIRMMKTVCADFVYSKAQIIVGLVWIKHEMKIGYCEQM